MWIELDIRSYWHAGTGRGGEDDFDAVVERDGGGLPMLPGRHLKGLLRQAGCCLVAWKAEGWSDETLFALFGRDVEHPDPESAAYGSESRHATTAGGLTVTNARASWSLRKALRDNPELRSGLFVRMSSTAVGKEGLAKSGTLRTYELAVPMVLYSEVAWEPPGVLGPRGERGCEGLDTVGSAWCARVQDCLGLMRSVGAMRHRGFGEVVASIVRDMPVEEAS